MRRPLIGARDFETFIGQGEKAQGRSWRLTKGEVFGVCVYGGKEKKKRRKCEEFFKFLCEQESSMERMCAKIKHGKSVCKNQAWKGCCV